MKNLYNSDAQIFSFFTTLRHLPFVTYPTVSSSISLTSIARLLADCLRFGVCNVLTLAFVVCKELSGLFGMILLVALSCLFACSTWKQSNNGNKNCQLHRASKCNTSVAQLSNTVVYKFSFTKTVGSFFVWFTKLRLILFQMQDIVCTTDTISLILMQLRHLS